MEIVENQVMRSKKKAAVRFKLLLLILVGVLVIGAGAFGIRQWQRSRQIDEALREGQAAYEREDWAEAVRQLGRYVGRHSDSVDDPKIAIVCKQFSDALLSKQPLESSSIRVAMATYRRLLRDGEFDREICNRLALLYQGTGDLVELEYVAQMVEGHNPKDPRAQIWKAKAAAGKQDNAKAMTIVETLLPQLSGQEGHDQEYVEACLLAAQMIDNTRPNDKAAWFDRAVARDPQSALARVARAQYRREMAAKSRESEPALLKKATDDLSQAEKSEIIPPLTRLVLCDELRAHGLLDRAEAQVGKLDSVGRDEVRAAYVDPADWQLDKLLQKTYLLAAKGQDASALAEVEAGLKELKGPQHQITMLPISVELAAANNDIVLAQKRLDEYLALLKGGTPESEARRAHAIALVQLADGRGYEAIEELEPFAKMDVFTPAMRDLLALAYRSTGQQGRAAQLYGSTSPGTQGNRGAAIASVQAILRSGDLRGARDALADLQSRYPDEVSFKLMGVEAQLAVERLDPEHDDHMALASAITRLQTIKEKKPGEFKVRTMLARMYAANDQLADAEKALIDARSDFSKLPEAVVELAGFYSTHDRLPDAMKVLEQARAEHTDWTQPWLASAELLMRQDQTAEAVEVLESGLQAVGAESKAAIVRRLAAIEIEDPTSRENGISRLRQLAQDDPRDIETRSFLLQLKEVSEDRDAARKLIEEIKRVEGTTGLRWRFHEAQLAAIDLVNSGDNAKGSLRARTEELLNYCIDANPSWNAPVMVLGGVYEAVIERELAERLYRRSLDTAPTQDVLNRLLTMLERDRRFKEAIDVMDRYDSLFAASDYYSRRLNLVAATGDVNLVEAQLASQSENAALDPSAQVLAAVVGFARDRDVSRAEDALKAAQEAGADPIAVMATRVRILRAVDRLDDARVALNGLVSSLGSFDSRLLRGAFLASIGETDEAEADFRALPTLADDASGYAQLGQFFAEQGRFSESIETSKAGLLKFPDAAELKRGMLKALAIRRETGDLDLAAEIIDSMKPDDRNIGVLRVKAFVEMARGGPDVGNRIAAIIDEAANATQPQGLISDFRGLIELALQNRQALAAEKLLNAAKRLYNNNEPDLLTAEAMIMIARGKATAAVFPLRQAVATSGSDPAIYDMILMIGAVTNDNGLLREFMQYLEPALNGAPTNARLQLVRARIQQRLQGPAVAADALAAFLETNEGTGSRIESLLTLAELRRQARQFSEAESAVARAEAAGADPLVLKSARLDLLGTQGQIDQLEQLVTDVLDDSEVSEAAHLDFVMRGAQYLLSQEAGNQLSLAASLHELMIQKHPRNVTSRLALALIFSQQGKKDETIATYKAVLEIDPNRDEALNNLAWLLLKEHDDLAQAEDLARRAVAQNQEDPNYRDTLGEVLLALGGKPKEAREQYLKCAEMLPPNSPDQARAYLKLAKVCSVQEATGDAIKYLRTARRIDEAYVLSTKSHALSESELQEVAEMVESLGDGS